MKLKMNQLLIVVLVTGFLFGIFYVRKMGIEGHVFDPIVIKLFQIHKLDNKKYLIYILKERVGTVLLVLFFSNVRWKQIYGGLLTFVLGIAGGSVITMAITQAGIRGVINCVLYLMPHVVFYGLVFGILLNYWTKSGRWSWIKTCGIIIFMLLGVLSEVYINPTLVKTVVP